MIVKTRGIVTRAVKYAETSLICDIYTEQLGLQTYIVSGVRKKKSRFGAGLLQLMSILEIDAQHQNNKSMHRILEAKPAYVYTRLPFEITRSSVGLFMIELVQKSIKEQEQNRVLFEFLYDAFSQLDQTPHSIANWHISFMVQLADYLGFKLDDNFSAEMPYFDIREGRFRTVRIFSQDGLDQHLSEILFAFTQLPFSEVHNIRMHREQRQLLLQRLIRYYQYRIEHFKELNTFNILQSIF